MIIAHLQHDVFETVRSELSDLGVRRVTIAQVHSTSPQAPVTLRYRGTTLQTHLRAEIRLECVAADRYAAAVIDVLRAQAGPDGEIAVLALEALHQPQRPEDDVFSDDPRFDAAVR